jgi:hypothetical protein
VRTIELRPRAPAAGLDKMRLSSRTDEHQGTQTQATLGISSPTAPLRRTFA